MLLDNEIYQGILFVTTKILKDNFFYSNECLDRFFTIYTEVMTDEYEQFECTACMDFKYNLDTDPELKRDFTSYFVSTNLHDILVHDLHFNDLELFAFDNLLPEYIGAKHDAKQNNERAHY